MAWKPRVGLVGVRPCAFCETTYFSEQGCGPGHSFIRAGNRSSGPLIGGSPGGPARRGANRLPGPRPSPGRSRARRDAPEAARDDNARAAARLAERAAPINVRAGRLPLVSAEDRPAFGRKRGGGADRARLPSGVPACRFGADRHATIHALLAQGHGIRDRGGGNASVSSRARAAGQRVEPALPGEPVRLVRAFGHMTRIVRR